MIENVLIEKKTTPIQGLKASLLSMLGFATLMYLVARFVVTHFISVEFVDSMDLALVDQLFMVALYVVGLLWMIGNFWSQEVTFSKLFFRIRHKQFPAHYNRSVVLTLFFSMTIALIVGLIKEVYFPSEANPALMPGRDGVHPIVSNILSIVLMVVLAPVVEELFFRGTLVNAWGRKNIALGVILSGIFFSMLHVEPVGKFIFSLLNALVYLRTRNLAYPVLLHFINNALVVPLLMVGLLSETTTTTTPRLTFADIVAPLIFCGIIALVLSVPAIRFLRHEWRELVSKKPYEKELKNS